MLRIKSKRNNFRRCGVAHPDQWVEYPEGRFTAKEIAILKAEPMLQVEVTVPEENNGTGPDAENGELAAMTVEQLKDEIAAFQSVKILKGLKKDELIGILKSHREAAEKKSGTQKER